MTDSNDVLCRPSVLTLVAGLAVIGLYSVLRALEVGKIGAPTDIGGGVIALVGYIVTGVGAFLVVATSYAGGVPPVSDRLGLWLDPGP